MIRCTCQLYLIQGVEERILQTLALSSPLPCEKLFCFIAVSAPLLLRFIRQPLYNGRLSPLSSRCIHSECQSPRISLSVGCVLSPSVWAACSPARTNFLYCFWPNSLSGSALNRAAAMCASSFCASPFLCADPTRALLPSSENASFTH